MMFFDMSLSTRSADFFVLRASTRNTNVVADDTRRRIYFFFNHLTTGHIPRLPDGRLFYVFSRLDLGRPVTRCVPVTFRRTISEEPTWHASGRNHTGSCRRTTSRVIDGLVKYFYRFSTPCERIFFTVAEYNPAHVIQRFVIFLFLRCSVIRAFFFHFADGLKKCTFRCRPNRFFEAFSPLAVIGISVLPGHDAKSIVVRQQRCLKQRLRFPIRRWRAIYSMLLAPSMSLSFLFSDQVEWQANIRNIRFALFSIRDVVKRTLTFTGVHCLTFCLSDKSLTTNVNRRSRKIFVGFQ